MNDDMEAADKLRASGATFAVAILRAAQVYQGATDWHRQVPAAAELN